MSPPSCSTRYVDRTMFVLNGFAFARSGNFNPRGLCEGEGVVSENIWDEKCP
jgi:hypothetical protein